MPRPRQKRPHTCSSLHRHNLIERRGRYDRVGVSTSSRCYCSAQGMGRAGGYRCYAWMQQNSAADSIIKTASIKHHVQGRSSPQSMLFRSQSQYPFWRSDMSPVQSGYPKLAAGLRVGLGVGQSMGASGSTQSKPESPQS